MRASASASSPLRRRAVGILLSLALASIAAAANPPPGTPLTFTVCGADQLGPDVPDIDARLELLHAIGVTSIESYLYWNKIEKSPGVFDWSAYDREALKFKQHGIKWVPFVIVGPWYVTPEFVRQDPQITMLRCLEHGRDSKIPSIWSPRTREYYRTYLARFAEHFRPMGVFESVIIGISGDYGEAIYSVIGNWPGAYHSHDGYWCGDPLAEADFRKHAQELYPAGIAALNQAWKTNYAGFGDVKIFSPTRAPSERAWQEFLAWYRGSMTAYADSCLAATRAVLPDVDLYLCTGGDMSPTHGSDFFEQAKIAAKYRAGLRITNESSSFAGNVRYTRMCDSAGRFYGAYVGHEPASSVTPAGMVGRIFNAITSGANQFYTYYNEDIVNTRGPRPVLGPSGVYLQRYQPLMHTTSPKVDTAVYHFNFSSQQVLSAQVSQQALSDFAKLLADVRRFIDYDLIDDHMIQDGALDQKKILIVATTEVMDARTTARITDWVRRGGVLFSLGSRPVDWDGSTAPYDALAGLTPQTDQLDAISTDGIRVPRPDVLPSIATLPDVIFTRAYTELAPDAEILLGMVYAPKAGVAWRRMIGRGAVFTYFGPLDLNVDEGDWKVSHRLPMRFMRDSLEACIREKTLAEIPPSLNLENPEVFKVMTDSGLWLLNMGDEAHTVTALGRQVAVPPHAIIAP